MENGKKISIYIVEDYRLMRKSLLHIINRVKDFEVYGDFEMAEDCIDAFMKKPADIVIMDLGLSGMNGLEATTIIKEHYPETKVIILTSHENENEVYASLAIGANAYCLKDTASKEMEIIIRETYKGALWLHPQIANIARTMAPKPNSQKLDNLYTNAAEGASLTEREIEVLKFLVQGKTNAEIAEEIIISTHTAKAHVCSILAKLAVSDRVQAAVKAVRNKIVD